MSEEVDVDRALKVFQRFSIDPSAVVSNECAEGIEGSEPYMPSWFLPLAAREMGYFPTRTKLESFLKQAATSSESGCIIFASFLQFCEELVDTRGVPKQVIHEFVRNLDQGGGTIADAELRVLLVAASPSISAGEVEAIIEMLDPDGEGEISLAQLESILVEHQRPLGDMKRRSVTPRHSGSGRRLRRVRRSTKARPEQTTTDEPEGRGAEGSPHRHSWHDRQHSSRRHRRSRSRPQEVVNDDEGPLLSSPQPKAPPIRETSEDGNPDADRTFRRTERNTQVLSSLPPPARGVTPSVGGAPAVSGSRPRTAGASRRRYHSELTDTSIIVDPSPPASAIPAPSAERGRDAAAVERVIFSDEDVSPAAQPSASSHAETPHEPFPQAATTPVASAGLRDTAPEEPAALKESPTPKPKPKPSKNPINKCCTVC